MDRLFDVQGYASIAYDGWKEGDPNKATYWLEQTIKEAKEAIDAITAPSIWHHEHQA